MSDQMYREYILDHYKNPRNYGRLEHPDITHEENNPLCGDVVGMDFQVREGVIEDIRFHGRGCAISQASASLLTERLKGMPLDEAKKINKDDVIGELGIEISPARRLHHPGSHRRLRTLGPQLHAAADEPARRGGHRSGLLLPLHRAR